MKGWFLRVHEPWWYQIDKIYNFEHQPFKKSHVNEDLKQIKNKLHAVINGCVSLYLLSSRNAMCCCDHPIRSYQRSATTERLGASTKEGDLKRCNQQWQLGLINQDNDLSNIVAIKTVVDFLYLGKSQRCRSFDVIWFWMRVRMNEWWPRTRKYLCANECQYVPATANFLVLHQPRQ